jgi:hypothetical protein
VKVYVPVYIDIESTTREERDKRSDQLSHRLELLFWCFKALQFLAFLIELDYPIGGRFKKTRR